MKRKPAEHTPFELINKTYCPLCGSHKTEWDESDTPERVKILRAVNAYNRDQEIKGDLLKALKRLIDSMLFGPERVLRDDEIFSIELARKAIAKTEEAKCLKTAEHG